jgi:hypothetical protein
MGFFPKCHVGKKNLMLTWHVGKNLYVPDAPSAGKHFLRTPRRLLVLKSFKMFPQLNPSLNKRPISVKRDSESVSSGPRDEAL